jgi:hypothetical protein
MTARKALWLLIAISSVPRVIAATVLGLGNDEAYHFLYAIYPDLSYYDHPPMLAWVESVGLSLTSDPFSFLALRSGFILLFALSTWLIWRIGRRLHGDWAGFYAALALNLTGYYGLAASTFALPDGPLLFFWLLTIDRVSLAIEQPHRVLPWVWVGLAWGCALLSKYHAVFLPAGVLLLFVAHPPLRHWFRKPGPYLAIVIGLLVFSPVLIWNARHDWVSFLFQGGRAVGGLVPRPDALAMAILAQVCYLFPWIWVPLVVALYQGIRHWKRLESDQERLAVCLAVVPLGIFTAVACIRPVLPHWGLIGLVSLLPALGERWRALSLNSPPLFRKKMIAASAFPLFLLGLTLLEWKTGVLQGDSSHDWGVVTRRTDPTADLYGWNELSDRLQALGVLDEPNTFLVTRNWYQSAQVAHATRMKRPVLCYNIDDPRGFAFWDRPEQFVGKDAVFLIIDEEHLPISFYSRWFEHSTQLDDFTITRNGKPIRHVQAFRLSRQIASFPFDFSGEREAALAARKTGGHPLGAIALPQRASRNIDDATSLR